MKANFKSIVSGIIIGATLSSGIAIAKTGTENLEAWYANIQIMINGTKIQPKDANGNMVEPFIVNGTTYLPVRAVGEALGKEVTWDSETNTVYLSDQPTATPTPAPTATPVPTATPAPTPTVTKQPEPTEYTYSTKQILQISGYREAAIKGEINTAWDSATPNAKFTAKMRCNNGGLADYIDCEITLSEVLSSAKDGFAGYFDVSMNGNIRHKGIKGTLSVEKNTLSLHTEEYDYHLVAMLPEIKEESEEKLACFYSLDAIKLNGEKSSGLIGLDFSEVHSTPTFSGSFTSEEQAYNLLLNETLSVSDNQIEGIFTISRDGEALIKRANGILTNLNAPLGDVMELTIEGFATLQLRVIEIGY